MSTCFVSNWFHFILPNTINHLLFTLCLVSTLSFVIYDAKLHISVHWLKVNSVVTKSNNKARKIDVKKNDVLERREIYLIKIAFLFLKSNSPENNKSFILTKKKVTSRSKKERSTQKDLSLK